MWLGALLNIGDKVDYNGPPSLFFFKMKDNIGEGSYGKVRVVSHRKSKQAYALKYMSKDRIVRKRAVKCTIMERDILEKLNHDFVVNLRYAFQDDDTCFLVLDLMLGGDLRVHHRIHKRFPEQTVRIWFTELSGAIAYLHRQGIVHRDIKLDNILLDSLGHAHLSDFNVATHFDQNVPLQGMAGTFTYMAPEMFRKHGYSCAVDWWALAVMTFELLVGQKPFRTPVFANTQNRDRSEELVYATTLGWETAKARLPPHGSTFCSEPGLELLSQMLQNDVNKRLGTGMQPGAQELVVLRAHPWFKEVNFSAVERKEAVTGFLPDPRSSVDPIHNINEHVISPSFLKARNFDYDKDTSNMRPDLRALHERFHAYDWERSDSFSKQARRKAKRPGSLQLLAEDAIPERPSSSFSDPPVASPTSATFSQNG
ncbi:kinase-like protein [Auriculariales sp. MPI-PUGE-AT-0066]|nr:kinase-like protein [Auriculariales sp. MPI-PUGE-AT-0066]